MTMGASANASTQLEGTNVNAHKEPTATTPSRMVASSPRLQVSTYVSTSSTSLAALDNLVFHHWLYSTHLLFHLTISPFRYDIFVQNTLGACQSI
jgi:hypothetical protein